MPSILLFQTQGTSSEQDARFFNKEKKLLKSLKVAPNIDAKVRHFVLTRKFNKACAGGHEQSEP